MTMFQVLKPVYQGQYVQWDPVVAIEAPTVAEAIAVAKKAGHKAPILDDFRTFDQRQRDAREDRMQEMAGYVR